MTNLETYFSRQRELVSYELRAEQEAYRDSLARRGLTLTGGIREAACRYPVNVEAAGRNAMGKCLVRVHYEVDDDEVELDFEPGKPATFFFLEGNQAKEVAQQYFVEWVGTHEMVLSAASHGGVESIVTHGQHHVLGLQLGVDNTSFRVMLDALSEAAHKEGERFDLLRSVLLGDRPAAFRNIIVPPCPWLNGSQNDAIRKAVAAEQVAIVHGPPGTGKTTTLVETIIETLQRETQVLVCAPSNAAVDWISEQLMRRGIEVLRIGNPLRVSDTMLDCSYERRYSAHPDYHELWNIRKTLAEGAKGDHAARLRHRETELEIKINADLFDNARVVSSTLIGSAHRMMQRRHFSTLFIDEAAQALEPACWAAILRADRVIMSGDHQQLPPTVKSIDAMRGGLTSTLMEKVVERQPRSVSLLTTQYRMNRDIMGFSSQWFYHGLLKAAPEVADRLISPLDTALTWIDTAEIPDNDLLNNPDQSEKRTHTGSITNAQEARLVIHLLRDYIDMLTPQKIENERTTFGIITPYRGQARLLRRLLRLQHYFRRLRRSITVGTVDGFQGQERDVIVISLVRSNDDGSIGFLRDLRRMNVAITRARMKLIIVGNSTTLCRHRFYRALYHYVQQKGIVVTQ